jgi:hypothetical protein
MPTWVPERSTVNQKIQIGAEAITALGTNVAASKLLECFDWVFGVESDINLYRPTGHKYENVQEQNTEWSSATLGGNLDYNGVVYPLASIMGSVTPVAHGASAVAKDWIFTPPVLGSIVPQTYTVEQGDTTYAHKVNYALFTDFGYKGTRKDFSVSGKVLSEPLQNGITLTGGATGVAIAPVVAKQVNVYLDTTSAGLGTTLITRALSIDFAFSNVYGPTWFLNRATVGWTVHVDMAPVTKFKLKVEADTNGMALMSGYLQTGNTAYIRVNSQGAVIDNNQTGTITGGPTGGTFTLTYKAQTTAGIAFNATGATVQTALLLLSTFPAGTITVAGGAGGPYTFQFLTTLLTDTTAITSSSAGLTGGASPLLTITQTQAYNTFQHDMAVKVGKPAPFSDDQGIFATEFECTIVEDPTWGKAQTLTITNLLTAL